MGQIAHVIEYLFNGLQDNDAFLYIDYVNFSYENDWLDLFFTTLQL